MNTHDNYCSADCLRKKYIKLKQVEHGQTLQTKEAYLVDDGTQIILSLKTSKRDESHPLGVQHTQKSVTDLWRKIAENPQENLMMVNEVCECSASVSAVQGVPLYNAQTTPGWLALRVGWNDYLMQKKKLSHEEWCSLMADLSAGLEHLHRLGIAHGDPYPFNAMVSNSGKAIWVDFGNITDDPAYFRKDVSAFVFYTLLFTQKRCEALSPSLMEDLIKATVQQDTCEVLKSCQMALRQHRTDWKYQFTDQDIFESFFNKFLQTKEVKENLHAWNLDHMIFMGNENYYEAFLYWMQKGAKSDETLEIEREKFRLYNAEADRLTVPRYVHEQVLKNLEMEREKFHLYNAEVERLTVPRCVHEQVLSQKEDAEREKQEILVTHNQTCEWADYLTNQLEQFKAAEVRNNLSFSMYANRIGEILEWKGFRRWILLYAFLKKFKNVSLRQKFNMVGGLLASLFGHKRGLGLSDYNPAVLIWKNLNAIQAITQSKTDTSQAMSEKTEAFHSIATVSEQMAVVQEKDEKLLLESATLPKVTVLLPVYNHAEFIHLAVESILNQTYNNLELIMLDDGSTDGLKDKIKKYQFDYRFKFYQQPNQKLPMALTHLHELATGDYITWTSADNIMEQDMIETLVGEMQRRPDAEMIFGDVRLIDENGDPLLNQEYRDFNRDLTTPDILRLPRNTEPLGAECDNYLNACFMYRRSASQALENHYASDLVGLEDYDYWLRMQRCGKIIHAKTMRPLYLYRVHKNTMSEELLTKKREQHINRSQKMFEMENSRVQWAKKRWHLNFQCGNALKQDLCNIAMELPVEMTAGENKNFWFFEDAVKSVGNLQKDAYCLCNNEMYRLGRFVDGKWQERVKLPMGNQVNPLALKARYTHMPMPYYEYNNVNRLPVIGCHECIAAMDAEAVLEMVQNNRNFYFVFVNKEQDESKETKEFIKKIQSEWNAVYLGYREFGCPYQMYSSWNAVLIPKMNGVNDNQILHTYQLALALGKWCAYEERYDCMNGLLYSIPYGIHHDFSDIAVVMQQSVDFEHMDLCLSTMNCKARMEQLLRYANAMMQDCNIERPNFGIDIPKEVKPIFITPDHSSFIGELKNQKGYIALAVDHLNQGGMEQVVAMLAYKLREYGLPVEVLCTVDGGAVADQLREDGIKVTEFQGNSNKLRSYLKENRPIIISSHYLHSCTEVPHQLGIPMVETIHNMLAFFDGDAWLKEKARSTDFDAYIAVSEMVRRYYSAFNDKVGTEKITVIGNAADPRRVSGMTKGIFRASIGLKPTDFVYMFIASFDGRKNHIGLITAFNEARKRLDAPIKLVLMGNVLDQNFYNKCREYIDSCNCEDSVKIVSYRKGIAGALADADVAVIPSYIEGWSISATEAQYAAKPLIHTDCGSGRELCGNNEYGILIANPAGDPLKMDQTVLYSSMMQANPVNTEELVEALCKVYEERDEWLKKAPAIRTRAINEFNYDKMVQKYIEVFCSILRKTTKVKDNSHQ